MRNGPEDVDRVTPVRNGLGEVVDRVTPVSTLAVECETPVKIDVVFCEGSEVVE